MGPVGHGRAGWHVDRLAAGRLRATCDERPAAEPGRCSGARSAIDTLPLPEPAGSIDDARSASSRPRFSPRGAFILVVAAGILSAIRLRHFRQSSRVRSARRACDVSRRGFALPVDRDVVGPVRLLLRVWGGGRTRSVRPRSWTRCRSCADPAGVVVLVCGPAVSGLRPRFSTRRACSASIFLSASTYSFAWSGVRPPSVSTMWCSSRSTSAAMRSLSPHTKNSAPSSSHAQRSRACSRIRCWTYTLCRLVARERDVEPQQPVVARSRSARLHRRSRWRAAVRRRTASSGRGAPVTRRSSTNARNGARPVPGPTMIIGASRSAGIAKCFCWFWRYSSASVPRSATVRRARWSRRRRARGRGSCTAPTRPAGAPRRDARFRLDAIE